MALRHRLANESELSVRPLIAPLLVSAALVPFSPCQRLALSTRARPGGGMKRSEEVPGANKLFSVNARTVKGDVCVFGVGREEKYSFCNTGHIFHFIHRHSSQTRVGL